MKNEKRALQSLHDANIKYIDLNHELWDATEVGMPESELIKIKRRMDRAGNKLSKEIQKVGKH